jgi:hypothetical protein
LVREDLARWRLWEVPKGMFDEALSAGLVGEILEGVSGLGKVEDLEILGILERNNTRGRFLWR